MIDYTDFPDSFTAWIEQYQRLAINGVRSASVANKIALHLRRFSEFFQAAYGHDHLSICLRRDVAAWQSALQTQGLTAAPVNNHLPSLSGFTTWGCSHQPD